uniref:Uncharacterized protein n=1 Tax=Fagus sylvatica TaxID=28930 RepID=A0A2N9GAS3_FAGSY
MDKNKLLKNVTTVLNGHNYVMWSQDMRSFLKGHRLWRYVTSEIHAPIRSKDEDDTKFTDLLKDWDCKNHQIITWFRHSTVPTIHQQFGRYDNAKDVWIFSVVTILLPGLSHEYQLWGLLVNMKQAPRQWINEFFSGMQSIWDQLEQSAHIFKDPINATILATKRDQFRLIQFLMALTSEFEPVLTALLEQVLSQDWSHCIQLSQPRPPKPGQSGILPRPINHFVAVAAKESPSDPSLSYVSVNELGPLVFTMVKQFLSTSNKVSSAVSGKTWYFDSACCNHMSLDSQLFSSVIPTTYTPLIQTANGSHISASHTGSISTPTLSLSDTYLIPNLTLNLISVGQLCELGFDLWFGSSGCCMQVCRILGRIRAFLISVSCPERFWGEAALTTVYTINRLPSSALQNVSLFERLYVSPLTPPPVMVPILDQTPDLSLTTPPAASLAPPLVVDPILDQTSDLPLAAPPAHSPVSPQEPASPVDPVTDQTPPLPLRRSDRAMIEELQALEKTHTWDLVDLPRGKFSIGCKWVYKIKTKSDGTIERYKARLIAKGYAQEYGIDYEETFAPVARITSIRSLLAIAAAPPGYSDCPDKVCLLRRALYGLKQAPRAWSLLIPLVIISLKAKYASNLLSRAGLTDTKVVSTPLEMNARLTPLDGTPLSDATLYRQLVGNLVYLTVTCPDIAHAVHLVSQFLAAPHSTHYAAVIHILRYIKGTMFHGIHFSAHSTLDLCAYSDTDWAGDPTDPPLYYWIFTEAEYRALADTTSELLALRWLLEDMGLTHSSPTVIHCDNRSAIQIAHNDVFHERTKHIEIDCHLVRHHLFAGILHLLLVSSFDQTADIFMKTFPSWSFS